MKKIILTLLICFSIGCADNILEPNKVFIYSVTATPTNDENVVIKNNSGSTVSLEGWIIGDKNDPNAYIIPAGNTFDQGESYIFYASSIGIGINNSGEIIYLKDPSGQTVDTWSN